MMDKAVARMEQLYTQALVDGTLRPDPSLVIEEPVDPEELEAQETGEEMAVEVTSAQAIVPGLVSVSVQFDTPDAGSVEQGEAALRSVPGVRSATTSSLALGRSEEHTSELQSLMRISYAVFCLKKKKIHVETHHNHK